MGAFYPPVAEDFVDDLFMIHSKFESEHHVSAFGGRGLGYHCSVALPMSYRDDTENARQLGSIFTNIFENKRYIETIELGSIPNSMIETTLSAHVVE